MEHKEHNKNLRDRSGEINNKDRLVAFLYELMRDHLRVGEVERLVRNQTKYDEYIEAYEFTNGWLANIAIDMAKRLK